MIDFIEDNGRMSLLEKLVTWRDRDGLSFRGIAKRIDISKSHAHRLYQEAKKDGNDENK